MQLIRRQMDASVRNTLNDQDCRAFIPLFIHSLTPFYTHSLIPVCSHNLFMYLLKRVLRSHPKLSTGTDKIKKITLQEFVLAVRIHSFI